MPGDIEVPIEFIQAVAQLRLPQHVGQRLQKLIDANTNGTLIPEE